MLLTFEASFPCVNVPLFIKSEQVNELTVPNGAQFCPNWPTRFRKSVVLVTPSLLLSVVHCCKV